MRADGLHRLLFYQPQHQTGYLLGLSAVLALYQARDISRPAVFLLIGGFLGACMLSSTVSLLLLAGMCAAYAGWRILGERRWRAVVPCAAAAAAPMLAALLLTYALGYVDAGGQLLTFGLNPKSTHRVLWVTFLSFGPVVSVQSSVSFWRSARERSRHSRRSGSCWRCVACSISSSISPIRRTASAGTRPRWASWASRRSSGSRSRTRGVAADGFGRRLFLPWRCSGSRRCHGGDRRV